jgi:hypothetical protein
MLGVTKQRAVRSCVADDFPPAAKSIGSRRIWRRTDVEAWLFAQPVVWHSALEQISSSVPQPGGLGS